MQNRSVYFSALIVVTMLLSACTPAPSASLQKSSVPRDANPNVPPADLATLVDGNNAFALGLYEELGHRDGNLVFSPYSISLALAMTYAGARGETESQMAQAMQFTLSQDKLHPAFNALDLLLAGEGKAPGNGGQPLQLNIANSIWAEQTYPFQQAYLDLIAKNYGAGIQLADFIKNFDPVRQQINRWVSDQTKNKINDLLAPGSVNSSTRMVLVNAIYFKADWDVPFDPNDTSDSPFTLLDGSQIQVKMMNNSDLTLSYLKGDGYQAVELPYNGNTAAMDIILPDAGTFQTFESNLDAQTLSNIFNSMQSTPIMLGCPKFTFSADFSLSDQLKSLGMTDAFDSNKADFSGMTGDHDLFIGDVVHKAFVAVDEKGTEAAAATAAIMMAMSAPSQSKVRLVIDRPFIFVIRDLTSGQFLFIGRVLNPVQG
ncbi:MAG TPA: serpin family protein [Anaerolineales bacterium]|nr:serpin family protein [Anaerolineales bacterium]